MPGWPPAKSLCLLPQLYPASLAYGRNLLTGEPSPAGRWRVRNLVAWCRPNPPVGSLGDKFRPATSYLTVACVGAQRYFDLDAVREAGNEQYAQRRLTTPVWRRGGVPSPKTGEGYTSGAGEEPRTWTHPAGAPPLDWWQIPTHPYPGAHYATWPPDLCTRPVLAMCPQRVCTTCGRPSERLTGETTYERYGQPCEPDVGNFAVGQTNLDGRRHVLGHSTRVAPTIGWSDCGHDTWRRGHILDPFCGSGTTLEVATGHGRDATGIDLDPRNAQLAYERIGGLFLTIETGP